jgi:hypothetical protein
MLHELTSTFQEWESAEAARVIVRLKKFIVLLGTKRDAGLQQEEERLRVAQEIITKVPNLSDVVPPIIPVHRELTIERRGEACQASYHQAYSC